MDNSVVGRISFLLKAEVNQLIDRAEDPVRMAFMLKLELEESLREARRAYGDLVPTVAAAQELVLQNQANIAKWQGRAEARAIDQDQEGVRSCLAQKATYEAAAATLLEAATQKQKMEASLKAAVAKLQQQFDQVSTIVEEMQATKSFSRVENQIASTQQNLGGDLARWREAVLHDADVAAARTEVLGTANGSVHNASDLDAQVEELMHKHKPR